ncbi:hypothetical protein PCASD_24705 [Puccinia coronata f. sp. avenae]|uniref:CxC1-like cysteine cluster associated with KDZ transposases domain-containing protein n=1 Tax=Puccinia coronata f. sp. avenae TaxID=200324 RepID=A0A2N5SG48_9BASI|nr:hypothetical protein PCASD_24705 [Puccinia coronata f. sp. avenae]
MKTGLHQVKSVNDQLILSLDGNFQHRHQKAAGRNYSLLITPDIFVQPRDLDEMKQYIKAQEALHKVPKKKDKCADSHKAADDTRSDTNWKGCDNTGLMGSCCRHDSVIYMANIHATGENCALPLTILKRILGNLDPDRPVGILYDIGCSLNKYMASRDILPDICPQLKFGTAVFHAYAHEWSCQVK